MKKSKNNSENMFYITQSAESKERYKRLLSGVAQASVFFSNNPKPFIHYRSAEAVFCKAFNAEDVSRQDVSVDAVKNYDGIGIKTFLSNGPLKYEKIAEFDDRNRYPLPKDGGLAVAKMISNYRNIRISETIKKFNLQSCIYHYLIRDTGRIHICEGLMSPIEVTSIRLNEVQRRSHIIKFADRSNSYHYHLTKNTLYMAFNTAVILETINIGEGVDEQLLLEAIREFGGSGSAEKILQKKEYVILPLFSTLTGEVSNKSGLNQWNAGGRKRDPDEIYIPIPRIVHQKKHGFFPPRNKHFLLKTMDGKEFRAKVCQDNSKALMTYPNKDLGKWLLRDVLQIPYGQPVIYEDLRKKNADTVVVYKLRDDAYQIALHSFGAYKEEYGD